MAKIVAAYGSDAKKSNAVEQLGEIGDGTRHRAERAVDGRPAAVEGDVRDHLVDLGHVVSSVATGSRPCGCR